MVDYGYEFSQLMETKRSQGEISQEADIEVRSRCKAFLVRVCKELLSRMPDNLTQLKKVSNLSPSVCLSQVRPPFRNLPLEFAKTQSLEKIENQWRNLLNVDWSSMYGKKALEDYCSFWAKVYEFKNAAGEFTFRDLGQFALTIYSMPISNALVE